MTEPETQGQPGWFQPLKIPAFAIRARYLATDGSRPEELSLEWGDAVPPRPVIERMVQMCQEIAVAGHVEITEEANGRRTPRRPLVRPDQQLPPGSPEGETTAQEQCGAFLRDAGPGHSHVCAEPLGHDPIEREGRAHRCGCGGLFMADSEMIDVPGRQERRERDERRGGRNR